MTDLNQLLKDFYDNRLSYKQVYREKFEALLTAMVADIEALKAARCDPYGVAPPLDIGAMGTKFMAAVATEAKAKRGPGRPPKDEANG